MKLTTKYNIGDDVFVIFRNKPFKARVSGVKVVAKEIIVLGDKSVTEAKTSLKKRYLISNKWVDEELISKTEEELTGVKPWVEQRPKVKPIAPKVNKNSIDDLPL